MSETLEEKFELMKREVDALQIHIMESKTPWYKSASNLVSIIALAFSFGTTVVSYRHADQQDDQSARQELRGMLQRLAVLPRENIEFSKKYADDPGVAMALGGLVNQENTLLIRQAAELARKLRPKQLVSAPEYYSVGVALQSSYDLNGAEEFLRYTMESATDFNVEIAAQRMIAGLQYLRGHPEAGRVEFQKARNIFSKYPGFDPFTQASTHIWTELAWAGAERNVGALDAARTHVDAAKSIANSMAPSPGAAALMAQVAQAELQFANVSPNTTQPLPSVHGGMPLPEVH